MHCSQLDSVCSSAQFLLQRLHMELVLLTCSWLLQSHTSITHTHTHRLCFRILYAYLYFLLYKNLSDFLAFLPGVPGWLFSELCCLTSFASLSYRSPRSQACHCLGAHYKAVKTFGCGNGPIQGVILHPEVSDPFSCLPFLPLCVFCIFSNAKKMTCDVRSPEGRKERANAWE